MHAVNPKRVIPYLHSVARDTSVDRIARHGSKATI